MRHASMVLPHMFLLHPPGAGHMKLSQLDTRQRNRRTSSWSCEHSSDKGEGTSYLDRVKRTTSTLWMELHPPNPLPRLCCRFDTLDGRVVTVDEEGFPPLRERILERESVLVVLAETSCQEISDGRARVTHLVTYTLPALMEPEDARARTGWLCPRFPNLIRYASNPAARPMIW